MSEVQVAAEQLIAAGQYFHSRGWVPATGGNFSALLAPNRILVTTSGNHKGALTLTDFLACDLQGTREDPRQKPSYETGLHLQVYQRLPDVGAVLHTHSIANTVLSRRASRINLTGFELQKVLPGHPDPSTTTVVPVFANDQNIARLAVMVDSYMQQHPQMPGYLIAGHGLYTWGKTVAEARYRVEALEFLLECVLTEQRLS